MKFEKPPCSPNELIVILKRNGLVIDDEIQAKYYLENIGYYRLSAYFRPFQKYTDTKIGQKFRDGVTFKTILDLYIFDRQIRIHLLDALERIEVALRSNLTNVLSAKKGAHWYLDSNLFYCPNYHKGFIEKIKSDTDYINRGRKRSDAVRHYYEKYTDPRLPPSWVIMEELGFRALSCLFKQIQNEYKPEISAFFGVNNIVLISWFHSLTDLRNSCAHHSRTWNRAFRTIKVPRKRPELDIQNPQKLQGLICVTKYLAEKVSGDTKWHDRLLDLLNTCPVSYKKPMGFEQRINSP